MPWQDNSGNRGSNRGPWGQPPRGGNGGDNSGGRGQGEPPDLEELLEASRNRLRRAFPRGRGGANGGGRRGGGGIQLTPQLAGLIGAGVLALWLFSGIYQVNPGERALVTTFGKFTDIKAQGLKWHVPFPVQAVEIVLVDRTRTTELGPRSGTQRSADAVSESLMLTGDKNIADVSFSVDWNIDTSPQAEGELPGPAKFAFLIESPDNVVRAVAEAAMREVVGGNRLEPLLTSGRGNVAEQTQTIMQEALDSYNSGINIIRVNYQKADAPPQVRDAFLDVFNAGSEAERKVNDAQRYYNEKIPLARGEAQQILEGAAAYAARVTADARGQANRFNQIYAEYRQAPTVTRQRMYLETVEAVLADMNKIVIEEDAGSGVVPYLPLNELNRQNQAPRGGGTE